MSFSRLRTEWFGNIRGDLLAGTVVALALIPEAILHLQQKYGYTVSTLRRKPIIGEHLRVQCCKFWVK